MVEPLNLGIVLRSTGVAAFATDDAGCIVACNEAAAATLGLTIAEMMARPCFDILQGHDLSGHRFCSRRCPVRHLAGAKRPIDNITLLVRQGPHTSTLADLATIVLSNGNGDGRILLHLLRLVGAPPDSRLHAMTCRRSPPLTRRETDVLARIAAGLSVKEIAFELAMRMTTARTHVRNILRKFGVHRQIDAVLEGQRRGLV